jgi:sugar (pentulose or hexulose) kinase
MAAGGVSPETARATGLSAGTPVSAAIHDQYAAALGTGAVRPGRTMLGTGTVWVLLAVSDRPAEPILENAFVCHHVVEGLYGQIVSLVNGGSAVSWAMDVMGLGATDSGTLDQLLAKAPAASGGLCFYPFLAPSAPSGLTPGMKGRLAGLQLSHRPEHLARAVVEGLGFELKRHLECVQRAGIAVDKLVVGGAASTSRHTPQILADITRLPLACRSSEGASVLGAAVLARGLREPEHPLADLASEMVPPAREILPGPDAALYAGCFEKYMASLTSEFRSPGSE